MSATTERRWTPYSRSKPCPHCERTDLCQYSNDGTQLAEMCYGGDFDGATGPHTSKKLRMDFWIRSAPVDEAQAQASSKSNVQSDGTRPPKPEPDLLHRIYSELLSHLPLSREHQENLAGRGFSKAEMEKFGARSLGRERNHAAKRVSELFPSSWMGAPGLWSNNGRPSLKGSSGIVFPCRDLAGRITGLRIRLDTPYTDRKGKETKYQWVSSDKAGGNTPGAPFSFYPAGSDNSTVRVTEGEIKGFIAAERTGIPTISTPGIGFFCSDELIDWLLELQALTVVLCPDADFRIKPTVFDPVMDSIRLLRNGPTRFTPLVEAWGR